MKRAIALLIALMMLLAACGRSESEGKSKKHQKEDLYETGLEYKQDGDLENAEAAFLEAVQEDAEDVLSYLELADIYIRQEQYQEAWDILHQGQQETDSASIADKLLDFNSANVICDSDGKLRGKSHFADGELQWCHIYGYENELFTGVTHYDGDMKELGFVELTYNEAGMPTQSYIYYTNTGSLERLTMEYNEAGQLSKTAEYKLDDTLIGYSENSFDEDGYKNGEIYYDAEGNIYWELSYTHNAENMQSTRITKFHGKQVGTSEQTYSESGYPNGGKSRFQGAFDFQISYDVSYGGSHEREEVFEGEQTYARIICYNAPLQQLY